MLSEEALILFAAAGACALLILGVLELIAPTRPRHPRRRPARRPDPGRRAYSARAPSPRESSAVAEPVRAPAGPALEEVGPPIEQLLISQAEAIAPRVAIAPPPSPPPRQLRPPAPRATAESLVGRKPTPEPEAGVAVEPKRVVELKPAVEVKPAAELEPAVEVKPAVEPKRAVEPRAAGEPKRAVEPEPPAEPESRVELESRIELEPAAGLEPAVESASGVEPEAWLDAEAVGAGASGAPEEEDPPPSEREAPPMPSPPSVPRSPVEQCYALYEGEQFRDVVTQGALALEAVASGALDMDSPDLGKLWGVMGLARRALGDYVGARVAFQEAMAVAPRAHRGAWERHLAALALDVGRQLLAQAQTAGATDAEERVSTLYAAITWFDRGVAAAPRDDTLHEAAAAARAALWPTYERVTGELIQRQEYHAARRLLTEALTDADCPENLQKTFSELLVATHSGEVGQLTAEAIRRMQEGREAEALTTLDHAEELLSTIADDGIPDKRRQELERRLWWGYTKVGIRRLESGLYEEALEPLLHALGFSSAGAARLEETRGPVVRALEGLVVARSLLIEQLAEDGDRAAARAAGERLRAVLRAAMERGVTRVELIEVLVKADEVFERLGEPSV